MLWYLLEEVAGGGAVNHPGWVGSPLQKHFWLGFALVGLNASEAVGGNTPGRAPVGP